MVIQDVTKIISRARNIVSRAQIRGDKSSVIFREMLAHGDKSSSEYSVTFLEIDRIEIES